MSGRVLIDTCGWIEFLRSTKGSMGDYVARAIEHERAVLCGIVVTELLQGAKGKKERQKLDFLFTNIDILSTDDSCWHEAGIILQQLRSKGITLPLTDALISAVAVKHNVVVLSVDKHFLQLPVTMVELN